MLKLNDLVDTIHENTRFMIFREVDESNTFFTGYKEDMSGLMKALCEDYEVIYIRITFNVLFIKVKEI